jgi:hypothetical protein
MGFEPISPGSKPGIRPNELDRYSAARLTRTFAGNLVGLPGIEPGSACLRGKALASLSYRPENARTVSLEVLIATD